MTHKVLTAHDLGNGLAVFWSGGNEWSYLIDEAEVAATPARIAEFEQRVAAENAAYRVAGAYLIDVECAAGRIVPTHIRERIRTLGPTVRTDLGPQAELGVSLPIAAE